MSEKIKIKVKNKDKEKLLRELLKLVKEDYFSSYFETYFKERISIDYDEFPEYELKNLVKDFLECRLIEIETDSTY